MLVMAAGMFCLPLAHGATTLLIAALMLGLGNGIGSGMIMTLGADYSPAVGRAQFLGVWRLFADLGSTSGPALLSAATAAFSLAAGIVCIGVVALAAAGVLWHFVPRTARRPSG
jgi:MFS family permease